MFLNSLIIFSIVCFAFWAVFDKKALENSTPKDVCLLLALFSVFKIPFWIALLCCFGSSFSIPQDAVVWAAVTSLVYLGWMISYIYCLSKASASYVVGIQGAYPMVALVLSILVLHEQFFPERLAGSFLVFIGLYILTKAKQNGSAESENLDWKFFLVMVSCVLFAGAVPVSCKQGLVFTGAVEFEMVKSCFDVLGGLALFLLLRCQNHNFRLSNLKTLKNCALSTLVVALGYWSYFSALKIAEASYVIPIIACTPAMLYVFALIFLKEKYCYKVLTGIAFVTMGGILVQATQFYH